MKKINITEILKDCPKGMELYSPIFGVVYFEQVKDTGHATLIEVNTSSNSRQQFYPDGKYNTYYSDSECLLFPSKDQRDWSKFQTPFKDGDVISNDAFIAIFHKFDEGHMYYHCWYNTKYNNFKAKIDFGIGDVKEYVYATEEEKEKLFKAIKDNGYKWNPETKTLEKLIEPKFKVGNRIRNNKVDLGNIYTIIEVRESSYVVNKNNEHYNYNIDFVLQDDWELVPNKFDITTLKPFDKVLVRLNNDNQWYATWFSHIDEKYESYGRHYVTVAGKSYTQMIPYKGNEHLLGKTDDCDEYYKTWE